MSVYFWLALVLGLSGTVVSEALAVPEIRVLGWYVAGIVMGVHLGRSRPETSA